VTDSVLETEHHAGVPLSPEARPSAPLAERFVAAGQTVAFTLLAIVTALIVGAIVIVFTDPDTLDAWSDFFSDPLGALEASWDIVYASYQALFESSLGSTRALSRTVQEATPLIFAGLSVALAFRAGLFNIGAAGQLMMGASAAAYVGFTLDLPQALHVSLTLAAGLAGGALYGAIPGFLKAKTGAHEVISTIMLNNIAIFLLAWFLSLEAFQREGRNDPISPPVVASARLPDLPGPLDVDIAILLALATAGGVWWLLLRSTIGFRLRAVGSNSDAARAAGMSVGATYVLAMALAGGLAGAAGVIELISRPSGSLTLGFFAQVGFDAIALALVGRAKPGGVVAAAFLFGALQAGSTGMQAATQTPVDIIIVIQALIIAFVAAPAVVQAIWRVKAGRAQGAQQFATGWGTA
jgi:simple sugar transport system permease protein